MSMRIREISNYDDIIDSRDIIERIAELGNIDRRDLDQGERYELETLTELASDGEANVSDWRHGEALIRDSYFVEYAQEFADDIGAFNPNAADWPLSYINWEAAAEALKQDYTELDFDGVTYWARA